MLDIPVRVKDALRDGRLLKKYKIEVLKPGGNSIQGKVGEIASDTNYPYYVSSESNYFLTVTSISGGPAPYISLPIRVLHEDGTRTTFYLKGNETGTEIYGFSGNIVKGDYIVVPYDTWAAGVLTIDIYRCRPAMVKDFTIDNNNLVAESVKIDERMCSGSVLKFGLCEGASLEFQYFDKEDILGRQVQVFLDVQYINSSGNLAWYNNIPMGYYTVMKCPQQFSTGIYKATAYNKLMSDYLDANANSLIKSMPPDNDDGKISMYTLLTLGLEDYGVSPKRRDYTNLTIVSDTGIFVRSNVTTIKLIGSSAEYTPVFQARESYYISGVSSGSLVGFEDLSEYINLLNRSVQLMKEVVSPQIQDPDDLWEAIKSDFIEAFGIVITFTDNSIRLYTLPELMSGTVSNVYDIGKIGYIKNVSSIRVYIPQMFGILREGEVYRQIWVSDISLTSTSMTNKVYTMAATEFTEAELIDVDPDSLPDVTLRDLQTAVYELSCQFGQLSRTTDLFSGVELNQSALYPAEDLYPADTLYPSGTRERSVKSGYSKLWSEAGNVQTWRNLIITWKGLDENNIQTTFESSYVVNADGTQDYIMDDNWLFNNLTWTQAQIDTYAAAMVTKMQPISWFPFEMWGAGLPYLEVGDQIEIVDRDNVSHTSYVLERQLNGIQNLQDTYINGILDIF